MVPDHLTAIVAALKGQRPQGEVIKPGDTGDFIDLPPDPSYTEPHPYFVGDYLGRYPDQRNAQGDNAHSWDKTWNEALPLNNMDPREFMRGQPESRQGVDNNGTIFLRDKPALVPEIPMSQISPQAQMASLLFRGQ